MAIPRRTRYPEVRLSVPPSRGDRPAAVGVNDTRLTPEAMAAAVYSFLRTGIELTPVSGTLPDTEFDVIYYGVPELVWRAPGPSIQIHHNRVFLELTDNAAPQDGEAYVYRTGDPLRTRIRLGRQADAGDRVVAALYLKDVTS